MPPVAAHGRRGGSDGARGHRGEATGGQFEANLKALGFDGFTVDQRFTAATEAAVRRWQRSLHLPETGRVEVAAVSYAPGPVRVASRLVRIGAPRERPHEC
ncbi:MAG TPA: peptidoglycan-binding domain-containing protein [Micromonosporaceae bacterium]|nr:peptidoglycan-binding domain-containing protein [Micromonosporaceae bacterium]